MSRCFLFVCSYNNLHSYIYNVSSSNNPLKEQSERGESHKMTEQQSFPIFLAQDHLVLVVEDMESAIEKWRDQMGLPLQHYVDLEEHGIQQAFFRY